MQAKVAERRKMLQRSKKPNNLRKTIRLLQSIPIVLSVVVVIAFLLDTLDIYIMWYACPLFGFSIYTLSMLYLISRRLYVSRWSRILYLDLIMVSVVDLLDTIFKFSDRFLSLQGFLFSIFMSVVITSLFTYIYDKWKYKI